MLSEFRTSSPKDSDQSLFVVKFKQYTAGK